MAISSRPAEAAHHDELQAAPARPLHQAAEQHARQRAAAETGEEGSERRRRSEVELRQRGQADADRPGDAEVDGGEDDHQRQQRRIVRAPRAAPRRSRAACSDAPARRPPAGPSAARGSANSATITPRKLSASKKSAAATPQALDQQARRAPVRSSASSPWSSAAGRSRAAAARGSTSVGISAGPAGNEKASATPKAKVSSVELPELDGVEPDQRRHRADQHRAGRRRGHQHAPRREAVDHRAADQHQRRAGDRRGHQERAERHARAGQLQHQPGQRHQVELVAEQRDRRAEPQVAEVGHRERVAAAWRPAPGRFPRRPQAQSSSGHLAFDKVRIQSYSLSPGVSSSRPPPVLGLRPLLAFMLRFAPPSGTRIPCLPGPRARGAGTRESAWSSSSIRPDSGRG